MAMFCLTPCNPLTPSLHMYIHVYIPLLLCAHCNENHYRESPRSLISFTLRALTHLHGIPGTPWRTGRQVEPARAHLIGKSMAFHLPCMCLGPFEMSVTLGNSTTRVPLLQSFSTTSWLRRTCGSPRCKEIRVYCITRVVFHWHPRVICNKLYSQRDVSEPGLRWPCDEQ